MLIVILLACIGAIIGGCFWSKNTSYRCEGPTWVIAIASSLLLFAFVATVIVGVCYSDVIIIDDTIALYKTENSIIEEEISIIVSEYQAYEKGIINDTIEKVDPLVVFTAYPELKSNELVKSQIETYKENRNEIKHLELKKLNYEVLGWWLWFNIF